MTQAEIDTLVAESAGSAQRIKVDGQEMDRHRLSEVLALAKFQAGQLAARRPMNGIQFVSLKPCGGGGN